MRLGNGLPFLAQTFQMELDCFAHILLDFVMCGAGGDATRQVRGIC